MQLDVLVGGVPRGGTTVAAKFLSLHEDVFCYASETHLISLMQSMFSQLPCRADKVEAVIDFLHQQFLVAMVEMPRFNVNQGAHPKNLLFNEKHVACLVDAVRSHLTAQLSGVELYQTSLVTLRDLLAQVEQRPILGEKTPGNIFAMADYVGQAETKNIVVMREPFGVLRSMKSRVDGGDPYSSAFQGGLETNIGMYLEYATAAHRALQSSNSLLVSYEDMATNPALAVTRMLAFLGRTPEERVVRFVETGKDREIADRAPMHYRRLSVNSGFGELSPVDTWKVLSITRPIREALGYSDAVLAQFGFDISIEWPGLDVPTTVLPMSGFHQGEEAPWMKRKGSLIAYAGKGRSYNLTLELKSIFPEQVEGEVELKVFINGVLRESLKVGTGYQFTVIDVNVKADELVPISNKGGYAIIDLESSHAFVAIGHMDEGKDVREMSFLLSKAKISKESLFGFAEVKKRPLNHE